MPLSSRAAAALLFCTGFRNAAVYQFLPGYLSEAGRHDLTPAVMSCLLAASVCAPLWARLSRRYPPAVLYCAALCVGAALLSAVPVVVENGSGELLVALVFVAGIFLSSATLETSMAVETAKRTGRSYGTLRLFASAGAGTGSLITGLAVDSYSHSAAMQLQCAAAVAAACCAGSGVGAADAAADGERRKGGSGALVAVTRFGVPSLLASTAAFGGLLSVKNTYFGVHMTDGLHASSAVYGFAVLVGTMSELPVYLWMGRVGVGRAFVLAHVAYVCNALLLSVLPPTAAGAALAAAANLSHGLQSALYTSAWVSGVERLGGQDADFLLSIAFVCSECSLGGAAGVALWGRIWAAHGGSATLQLTAAAAALWASAWVLCGGADAVTRRQDGGRKE
eukprot:TRINITY_DN17031_c1_g1_i1.p1 TRINITY_DN17031_c1_g1~~TRINITY_DN17031_c1_g1_i1.p1  ORF type:complete len:394 (+),score=59.53 TRINITY_DN17031_c1_g1_i1:79-1260(+)